MATYGPRYQDHPACRTYEAAKGALDERYRRDVEATNDQTDWPVGVRAAQDRYSEEHVRIVAARDAALAAEGLRVHEYSTVDGYLVDLAEIDNNPA